MIQANENWTCKEEITRSRELQPTSEAFVRIKSEVFGYFDPADIFFDNMNDSVRGDLTDISAEIASLQMTREYHTIWANDDGMSPEKRSKNKKLQTTDEHR